MEQILKWKLKLLGLSKYRRDIWKIFSLLFLCLVCIGVLVGKLFYIHSNEIIYNSEMLVVVEGDTYEIKSEVNDKYTVFVYNGEEKVISNYPRTAFSRIDLPDLTSVKSENVLLGVEKSVDFEYDYSFSEGIKYLKFIIENGYSMKMYVSTPQYIDIYLMGTDGIWKRMILFRDSFMLCDMAEGADLPSVSDYIPEIELYMSK